MKSLEQLRAQYPALQNKVYMNFGAQGVMAEETLEAIMDAYRVVQRDGPLSAKTFRWISQQLNDTRKTFSTAFGGDPNQYAITQSVTDGCNIVMWGIEWDPGDHLLTTDSEHSGIVGIAQQLKRRRKIDVTYCAFDPDQPDEFLERFLNSLTARTKLVVFSQILWNTGHVLDAQALVRECKRQGVRVLIDGAQSAGVMPLDVSELGADFYAITGHKWLGGPEGVGCLHVRPDAMEHLEPTFVGWRSVTTSSQGEPVGWEPSAGRFEVATSAFPLLSGVRKAFEIHNAAGTQEHRFDLMLKNSILLRDELAKIKGVKLLADQPQASLVSFTVENKPHGQIVKALDDQNIIVRTIAKPDCIRASVHYMTTEAEINKLTTALSTAIGGTVATLA